jgi:hypothetical protein
MERPDGTRILVDDAGERCCCASAGIAPTGCGCCGDVHFAWAASTGVLFGLPLGGDVSFSSIIDTRAVGPVWLTGGYFGPAAAALSILFVLAAIPILVRVTEDYAWNYTHPPIIPGGYDVTIAPPAAHVAMEQSALDAGPVNPASLVQILPATPQSTAAGEPPR